MRKVVKLLVVVSLFFTLCACNRQAVVWDDVTDSFIYKPESDWDYINDLSPRDQPQNPSDATY